MASKVTSGGRITVPIAVRNHLGLASGGAVEFELAKDGRVVMTKVGASKPMSRFEKMRGIAGPGMSTDELMALTRG